MDQRKQPKDDAATNVVDQTTRVTQPRLEEHANRHLRHLKERALFTSGVCAEVAASDGDYASPRVRRSVTVFQQWVADEFGITDPEHMQFRHGLDRLDGLDELDPDFDVDAVVREIRAGAMVCEAVQLFWWADTSMEAARDAENVITDLAAYFAARWSPQH